MSIQNLALYVVCVVAVTFSPGPDILTVITRSVTQGTKAGLVATLGFATGLIYHTTIAATGLIFILQHSPAAFHVVQYLGAAYLLYLAQLMLRSKEQLSIDGTMQRKTLARIYGQSVVMNVLNPKVTLFFVAFLSRFGDPQVPLQMILLGAIFALCTLICFGACALAAGRLTGLLRKRPGAGKPLRYATAALFIGLAVSLLFVQQPRKESDATSTTRTG